MSKTSSDTGKKAEAAAVHSLADAYRLLIDIVVDHNNRPHSALKRRRILTQAGVRPIPKDAYLWGLKNISGLRVPPFADQDYKRLLLASDLASVANGVLRYKKRAYLPGNEAAIEQCNNIDGSVGFRENQGANWQPTCFTRSVMELAMSACDRLLQEVEKIKVIQQLQAQIDELDKIERWRKEFGAHHWTRQFMAAVEEHKKLMEMHNRWRDIMQAVTANLHHTVKHVLHRVQGRAGGRGKTSAKQKSSSSGGSSGGGDGGGDGDGPHRNRSKQKHRPSNSSHKSQRPPSVSPDASVHTSPPRRPSPGRDIAVILVILCLFGIALAVQGLVLQVLVILCLFIIALVALGHPEVAKDVWRSVPTLLKLLAGPPSDES